MEHEFLVFLLTVAIGGIGAQWLGWRLGIPAIVLLLATGVTAGPALGIIDPSELFGPLLQPIIGAAVAIVVFEGGLSLNLRDLDRAGTGIRRLVAVGLPLNWALGAMAAHWIGGIEWPIAVLIGAVLVVTGPTVILPLLRQTPIEQRPGALLKWEAVVNDPIGAILTVVVLEYLTAVGTGAALPGVLLDLAMGTVVALVAALAAAYAVRWAFHADLVPEVMKTPLLLSGTVALYAGTNLVLQEAGLLAATVFGLTLANINVSGLRPLSRYKESLSVLLVSSLFVILAADIDPAVFARLSWPALLLVAAFLVVRPVAILLATLRSGLSWPERLLTAWIGPRGIVAAAIAGIAGAHLSRSGYADADLVLPIVFLVIISTAVLQGLTLGPAARRLGLVAGEEPGLLIVGASPWTIELACLLRRLDVPVVMADRSWTALRPARDCDIPTINVEIMSEWVEEVLDTGDVAYLLAATEDDAYNALVCARLAPELGRERVHQLALRSGRLDARHTPGPDWRGKILAERHLDQTEANRLLLEENWQFVVRRIESGEGTAEEAQVDREKLLLVVRDKVGLLFHTPEREVKVQPGDLLIAFAPAEEAPVSRTRPAGAP